MNRLSRIAFAGAAVLATLSAVAITPPTEQKPATAKPAPKPGEPQVLEWDALLPESERMQLSAPPAQHDYLGEGGPGAQQSGSFEVNKSLEGVKVKIPGFLAPLAVNKEGEVSELFLVPYFGACIHVPPPPPNQIVYVRLAKPISVDSIYEAYWITGTMHTKSKGSRLGMAAYSMEADALEVYKN